MERIFILAMICFLFSSHCIAQNLLINGDFEETVPNNGNIRIYDKVFYAQNWFQPTDGSVDIYRDHGICSESNVMNMEGSLRFCVDAFSGNYCIGIRPISYAGYMEHITGKLIEPLVAGKKYKVSFYIKYYKNTYLAASKGFGFKFSGSAYLFGLPDETDEKPLPFYQKILIHDKIYADFEIEEYLIDTNWREVSAIYEARGGEMYITFGRFAYHNDYRIIRQLNRFGPSRHYERTKRAIAKNRSLVIKSFNAPGILTRPESLLNYYLLDNVAIEEIVATDTATSLMPAAGIMEESSDISKDIKKEFHIDPGFFGDLTFDLAPELAPKEAFFIDYGEKHIFIMINLDSTNKAPQEFKYTFIYPANRMKRKTLLMYEKKLTNAEIEELTGKYSFDLLISERLNGIVYHK